MLESTQNEAGVYVGDRGEGSAGTGKEATSEGAGQHVGSEPRQSWEGLILGVAIVGCYRVRTVTMLGQPTARR